MEHLKSSVSYNFYKFTQKWTLLGVLGVVALLSWIAVFASAQSSQLKVHFFDVGQGDAIFVELPDGRQILIDGGPNDKVVEKLGDVMPFFDREIDIVIASHNDADHIGGLPTVLAHYEVGAVIWNGIEVETKVFEEFKSAMDSEEAEVIIGRCCMRFNATESDPVTFFEILYPFNTSESDSKKLKQNDLSLVVRFVYGNNSFLFTGDIERQTEYELLKSNFNIKSDVLKVAHHGSKTSTSELFLEKVKPKVAVVSVSKRNTYGHPYPAILQRLKKYDIKIRRTDLEGDIIYESY